MKDNISKRDWETISAYLDGQLSQRKQARFEVRLNQDPDLQSILEQVNRTRQILRSAPRLTAPRNFMLTPEMAGHPRRLPRLAPVFGWASAVASFLLILVLAGDALGVAGFVPMTSRVAQQDEFGGASQVQAVESDALPAADRGQENAAGVAPENAEKTVPVEAAADPGFESAPEDQIVTDAKEIEMFAAAEAAPSDMPEDQAGVTTSGETALEAPAGAGPQGVVTEKVEERAVESQADVFVMESADHQSEGAAISNTVGIENDPDQLTEEPPMAEAALPPADDLVEPRSNDTAESQPDVAPQAKQADEMISKAEPTSDSDMALAARETTVRDTPAPEKTRDFVFGIEMILALFAAGAGLAWFYLRRRGG